MSQPPLDQLMPEPLGTILCVCDDDDCFCTNDVPLTPVIEADILSGDDYYAPCFNCAAGEHTYN